MIIIFSGTIGRSVTGGMTWINLQYLLGLRSLGHDVYYLEDCGNWSEVYNWEKEEPTWDLDYPSSYVKDCLTSHGFEDKWIYRAGKKSAGMNPVEFEELCFRADLLMIHAVPIPTWRKEYDLPKRRTFIDVDPGFTQIRLAQNIKPEFKENFSHCETLFTISQHIGDPDCSIPLAGKSWFKTLSPVFLPQWPVVDHLASHFSSIIRWHQKEGIEDLTYEGVVYGQRNREFPKFLDLPNLCKQSFRVALIGKAKDLLTHHNWEVVPGWVETFKPESYQGFIQDSRAEFGVAKHVYVSTKGGWFSDRSVCYLASGRPVLIQDTRLSDWLPTGEGVVVYKDLAGAIKGIETINKDYEKHARISRKIAEEYFSTEHVLPPLLSTAMA